MALTSIVMKCLEKIIINHVKTEVSSVLDAFQFAYRSNRSTDDAAVTITHLINRHLEDTSSYAPHVFLDFNSAFNMLQPHLLTKRLMDLKVLIIKWYQSFLTNRRQQVSIIKFSDDTAILGLLKKDGDLSEYFSEIRRFENWCDNKHLALNVGKTKEMVFDPRGVGDQNIAQVSSYKYLGVFFDDSLAWQMHVDNLCSKIQQRLHFLRRLRVHGVDQKCMVIFTRQ